MRWVAGVDGCRAGWVVVLLSDTQRGMHPQIKVCRRFKEVLRLLPKPAVIAVDIPIGLLDKPQRGGRACDQEARRLLGRRASSVFTPPSRRALKARKYSEVRRQGVSRQAFGILPKIREVDRLMSPKLQRRVYEAHPELAFRALVGNPMRFNKKTPQGHRERLDALKKSRSQMVKLLRDTRKAVWPTRVRPDDLLDACVLVHIAGRIAKNNAVRVPPIPPVDRKGLRMEIWF